MIDVITSGHFLVGSCLLKLQEYDHAGEPDSKQINAYQRIIAAFCRSWSKNYVAQLQRRTKWKASRVNVEVGDVVLLKQATSPLLWPLARVSKTILDRAGRVRIVKVHQGQKEFVRSLQQIVVLPVRKDP